MIATTIKLYFSTKKSISQYYTQSVLGYYSCICSYIGNSYIISYSDSYSVSNI